MNRRAALALPILMMTALGGCTTEFSAKSDTGTDTVAPPDTSADTLSDTPPDTTGDVVADVIPDTWLDTVADTVADTSMDTVTDTITDTGPDISPVCNYEGFEYVTQTATSNTGVLAYAAQSTEEFPADLLWIQLYADFGDPPALTGPGSYNIGSTDVERNLATCGTCVLIGMECTSVSMSCSRFFFAQEGLLQIDTWDTETNMFAGLLRDTSLVEVTVNWDTWESTIVDGAERWCVDSFLFESSITSSD